MPSRRHSSAMLSSPRSPSSTTRIFSSAEKCRRVARRMSLIASSAGCFSGPDFCLIFAPCGYDDPKILPTRKPPTVSKALTADSHSLCGHDGTSLHIALCRFQPERSDCGAQEGRFFDCFSLANRDWSVRLLKEHRVKLAVTENTRRNRLRSPRPAARVSRPSLDELR